MIDTRDLIDAMGEIVAKHNAGSPGVYRRWNSSAKDEDPGNLAYGIADAANILYTIGRFPSASTEREAWIREICSLQDAGSGLYASRDHHAYHTTAHCVAALELFDVRPEYPVSALLSLGEKAELERFLDGLDWVEKPWPQSHQGAGIYVALRLTGAVTVEWEDLYFGWLDREADPETGFWRRGCIEREDSAPLFHHLAGTFHYHFNYEYARRPVPEPGPMVDTCLAIEGKSLHAGLGRSIGFAEIDWVYCLHRASRQAGHRWGEAREALERFARGYVGFLRESLRKGEGGWGDIHSVFGVVCALAELQRALPGMIRTEIPLRLVLDRRPFI